MEMLREVVARDRSTDTLGISFSLTGTSESLRLDSPERIEIINHYKSV